MLFSLWKANKICIQRCAYFKHYLKIVLAPIGQKLQASFLLGWRCSSYLNILKSLCSIFFNQVKNSNRKSHFSDLKEWSFFCHLLFCFCFVLIWYWFYAYFLSFTLYGFAELGALHLLVTVLLCAFSAPWLLSRPHFHLMSWFGCICRLNKMK